MSSLYVLSLVMFFPTTVHRGYYLVVMPLCHIVKGLNVRFKSLTMAMETTIMHDLRIMTTIILSMHLILVIVCNDKLFPRIAVDQLARMQCLICLAILT